MSINKRQTRTRTLIRLRLKNPWPSNSRSNWNLEMLIFEEGGKPENPEKNPRSKDENQQQTQPTYDSGSGNRGGRRAHSPQLDVGVYELMMY